MDIYIRLYEQKKYESFTVLRNQVEQKRSVAISRRLVVNPSPTIQESILGAFIEMYELHLLPVIRLLLEKGYVVDTSSGFCGKFYESQTLNGDFHLDDTVRNKLAKIGVKIQTSEGIKSLKFWPEGANLDAIAGKHRMIAETLPISQEPIQPSQTSFAVKFRMTYIPDDKKLKKQRLFEILMYNVKQRVVQDTNKRLKENPVPDDVESRLGSFREMIEPQVRNSVLEFNRKGYSTDVSGFMDTAESQLIEGDFLVDETVKAKLETLGVTVSTNPSGYTRLQFWPTEANLKSITRKWDEIASLLPDKGSASFPSMTRKSRDFRNKY